MRFNANGTLNCFAILELLIGQQVLRCTAVQRVSIVSFDWIFESRVEKLVRITCVFNTFSTRI